MFFAELGRETVAAPYELEANSSVPVLATVPYGPEVFVRRSGPRPPDPGGAARQPAASVAVASQHTVEVAAAAPDQESMKLFARTSEAPDEPAPEPSAPAIVIHPLRPASAARTYEQSSSTQMDQRRNQGPSAAALAREPRAYPAAPPRMEGAVKRTYTVEPAAPESRPRVPLVQRSQSLRSAIPQRTHARCGQSAEEG